MSISIPAYYLKMPRSLPNDLEGMILTYPKKFPFITQHYEEVAQKYYADPEGFEAYGNSQLEELKAGLKKVKDEFDNKKEKSLKFLVETDQRLNKLFCYRFWIVNYLFADGPIHAFYVDNLKRLVPLIIEGENTSDFESKVEQTVQDLLQSDYADLYLIQALGANYVYKEISSIDAIKADVSELTDLIDANSLKNADKINKIWDKLWVGGLKDNELIKSKLAVAIEQVEFRQSMLPLYNALTHSIEFRKENLKLAERYDNMKSKVDHILNLAKAKLSQEESDLFEMSYHQARNFAKYKDVMGQIDGDLLPFWFGIHTTIRNMYKDEHPELKNAPSGQAAMFNQLIWYLPDDLKAMIMTPDMVDFSLETI